MNGFIHFLVMGIASFCKQASIKRCPDGMKHDYDRMRDDRLSGMSIDEVTRRANRGEYYIPVEEERARRKRSIPVEDIPMEVIPGVRDIKRYERDKKILGEKYAELKRAGGSYMIVYKS